MESKKNIGKFFRENLDQLDVAPSRMVWDEIEKDLKEKKKVRPFFLWFFIAAFVGGAISTFIVLQFNLVPNFNTVNEKTSIPAENNTNSTNKITTNYKINKEKKSKAVNDSSISISTNEPESLISSSSKNTKSSSLSKKIASEKKLARIDKNLTLKNKANKKQTLFFNAKKIKQKKNIDLKKTSSNAINNHLASNGNSSENNFEEKKSNLDNTNQLAITGGNTNSTIINSLQKKNNTISEKEKSLPKTKKDSVSELNDNKEFNITIAPYYGFTYSGKIGNNNTLSNQYNVVNEVGKLSQNFGVLIRWMKDEKIGIQTGIGIIQSHRFTEVEKNNSLFVGSHNLNTDNPMQFYASQFINDDKITFHEEINYIEVPLEVYYIWSQNKFGLASSFGLSLFFLNKNEVYLESTTVKKFRIGSSNNVIPQNFAVNTKLNLFYNLSKKIQLDLYPEFQFQIMSHKDVSRFYPYYFSLKLGVSYKF